MERWNEAHVKHDSRALEGLYAPRVQFYGQSLTGRRCAELKKAAFDKSPDFTQSIHEVTISSVDRKVSFTKTATEKGKSTDYPAVLVVNADGLITLESDKITDANLAAPNAQWCTENAPDVVDSIPNDKVITPYKISSRTAVSKATASKHFHDLEATAPGDFLVIDIISCPTKCAPATRECGYDMRVGDHSNIGKYPSILVDWLYVDAVDGTLWYDTDGKGWKSEPLP